MLTESQLNSSVEYDYVINLDERGEFYADVREPDNGASIYFVRSDFETGEIEQVSDGFMKHKKDVAGLQLYLRSLGFIRACDKIRLA